MKAHHLGWIVTMLLLPTIYSGCGGVENRRTETTTMTPSTRSLAEEEVVVAAAKPKKKRTLDFDNGRCTATFDENADGKLDKGTLNTSGICTKEEADGPLTINGQKVIDIGPAEFITDAPATLIAGSVCRYCYVNSAGGMSCVVYGVPPCPH